MTKKTKRVPVLVTTSHRGVFFGYVKKSKIKQALADTAEDGTAATLTLKDCRCCVYWSTEEKGFLGLASAGPGDKCRIGPAATKVRLKDITSVTDVTPAAVARWESAPWG